MSMTIEEYCWAEELGRLLGYRNPREWTEGMYPMLHLLPSQKRHRVVIIRGPLPFERSTPRPGWLRIQIGSVKNSYKLAAERDFDIAAPDSMEKAATFVRSTYTKSQRELEKRRLKRRPSNAS